jgi:gas vesicle protein
MDMRTEIILGIAGGAIVGLVAGLLLAPQSGRVTRNSLKDQMGQLKSRFRKNLDTRVLEPLGNRR